MDRREFLFGTSYAALSLFAARRLRADTSQSPITNCWGKVEPKKLILDEVCVFRGRPGAAYNHSPEVLFDHGRLYVSWSSGPVNEEDFGQHMAMSTSDDGGKTWSEESTITPPPPERTSLFLAAGIREYRGKLIATYSHTAYTDVVFDGGNEPPIRFITRALYTYDAQKPVRRDNYAEARISRDRGKTWSKPIRLIDGLGAGIIRPFATRSGRLILGGSRAFAYTDDPSGLHGWKLVRMPIRPECVDRNSDKQQSPCGRYYTKSYWEPSFYQTDDGVIHMMLRTVHRPHEKHNGLLAVSESHDDGLTWSEPVLTNFTDCASRSQFGRLPDGRYFGLSCPEPNSPRTPLVLSTSEDGIRFDRNYILGDLPGVNPRMPGAYKDHGTYGYPFCDIKGDTMHIVYSRAKEDIFYATLNLGRL